MHNARASGGVDIRTASDADDEDKCANNEEDGTSTREAADDDDDTSDADDEGASSGGIHASESGNRSSPGDLVLKITVRFDVPLICRTVD